jgi:outer membrane biosynthesis protein TonB
VLSQDIFTTGEVQFLPTPVEEEATAWHLQDNWPAKISSLVTHAALILLVVLQPKLFPFKPHTAEQNEMASKTLGMVYLPPSAPLAPAPPLTPAPQLSPQIRIDPRLFQRTNPEVEVPKELSPAPAPPRPERSSPEPGGGPEPERPRFVNPSPRFDPSTPSKPAQPSTSPFALPSSPGKALEESLRSAGKSRNSGPTTGVFGGDIPGGPLGSGSGGKAYGAIELLTPTEGVDFSNYLARVLASVRRNWYAVIPESARLGERGKVVLQFRIMRDGRVPPAEPQLMRTSGRQPLDFAAMSSIRSSNPFEPLPAQFSGPFIELRFIYLYNLPLDTP